MKWKGFKTRYVIYFHSDLIYGFFLMTGIISAHILEYVGDGL